MTSPARARACIAVAFLALLATTGRAAGPAPGSVPPDDVAITLSGEPMRLSGYAGKAVIVTFWATWCPYCLKELPILQNVQDQAGKDQIVVIAVNTEKSDVFRRATHVMKQAMHMEFTSDASGLARQAFGVTGLPHMVIIGRDGRVIKVYEGYTERKLDQIVADINVALAPAR